MKAAIIAIFTTALCLAGAAAEAKGGGKGGKGKAASSSSFKGSKTTTGHSFPSKAPKAGKNSK